MHTVSFDAAQKNLLFGLWKLYLPVQEVFHLNREHLEQLRLSMPQTALLYDLSDFFKVMGDGTRIQLLWALEEREELCVGDLAALLNMTPSAVSHQLRALRTAKLIRCRKDGKNVFYSLDDDHVKDILTKALEHIREREHHGGHSHSSVH